MKNNDIFKKKLFIGLLIGEPKKWTYCLEILLSNILII